VNRITGRVVAFRTHQGVSFVECRTESGLLGAVVLETQASAPWIAEEQKIALWFKETEVWPSPAEAQPPSPYFLKAILRSLQEGEILCRLDFDTPDGPVRALVDCAWAESIQKAGSECVHLRIHPAAIALREPGSEDP
jgi:hypothetical protein